MTIEITAEARINSFSKAEFIAAWKELARTKGNSSNNMLTYIIARALSKTDFQTQRVDITPYITSTIEYAKAAFPPITKTSKLAGGRKPYDTLDNLLYSFNPSLPGVDFSGEALYNMKQLAKAMLQELRTNG